jgi:hypothetical protein|tara:strand:+ start:1913 stop:4141 length:2229 start_codon:yes stop_codon:yes gene_type:complete
MNEPDGYMEQVTDEELITIINSEVAGSQGNFLDSSDLSDEREKATYEYAMQPIGHLAPQGVSKIVSSDTVEAIEGYSAVLSELLLNNKKLAKFIPYSQTAMGVHQARVASDVTNYCIFKKNKGWELINTWIKSALLWKNAAVVWEFVEDYEFTFQEFDEITTESLDMLLSDPEVEVVGDLYVNTGGVYENVRVKRTVNKSGVKIRNIEPESFLISQGASSIDDASFVGLRTEMTRSEIRKQYPDHSENIDWDTTNSTYTFAQAINNEKAARRTSVGLSNHSFGQNSNSEANQVVSVLECWMRVDRDGDGISELKRFITINDNILFEEDVDSIQICELKAFDIPHEWAGLSMADMTRPSTLASTAILRGFVENTYLTNYSPKLADPNVVDFSALQNMKPKQIVPTNGNPAMAVHNMPPEALSSGTVPLLEFLQQHKEQANGLSKAAQGLNDTLYVSGNSEQKVSAVQSAAQTRIQHIARRFMETGLAALCEGVYKTMTKEMRGQKMGYYDRNDFYGTVNISELPDNMMLQVEADVGDASNSTILSKMSMIGEKVLPALMGAGYKGAINPTAPAVIAFKTIEALGEDPLDYIVDYTSDEYKDSAMKDKEKEQQQAEEAKSIADVTTQTKIALDQANVDYTNVQSQNAIQDNLKQLVVALDKSYQEWAKLSLSAAKDGSEQPIQPDVQEMYGLAQSLIQQTMTQPKSNQEPKKPEQPPVQQEMQGQGLTPEAIQSFLGQGGGGMM